MKNKKIIIPFIICTIIIFIFSNISSKYASHKVNKSLLETVYFEDSEYSFFNSDSLYDTLSLNINLYNTSNLLEMCSNLNLNIPNDVITIINKQLKNDLLNNDLTLYQLLDLSKINYFTKNNNLNSSLIINKLYDYYDPETSLFFYENINEDISSKICATNTALTCFNYLDYIPKDILQNTSNSLLKYLYNDNFFTFNTSQAKENLFNNGLVILNNINLLSTFDENLLEALTYRTDWYIFWHNWFNEYLTTQTSFSLPATLGIIDLNRLSTYFDMPNISSDSYLKNIDEDLILNLIHSDLQIANDLSKLIPKNNPSNQKTSQYLKNLDFNMFIYSYTPNSVASIDLYFGDLLSTKYGFTYDRNKLKYFLDNDLNNISSIYDIYWTTNVYTNIIDNFKITDTYLHLKEQLTQQVSNLVLSNLNPRLLYTTIYLCDFYDISIQSKSYLSSKFKDLTFSNSSDLYYYVLLYDLVFDLSIDTNYLSDLIYTFLDLTSGGFKLETTSISADTMSTYRMLYLIDCYNIPFDYSLDKTINIFTSSIKGPNGGYFLFPTHYPSTDTSTISLDYKENFTLQSFWYGSEIDRLLNRIK